MDDDNPWSIIAEEGNHYVYYVSRDSVWFPLLHNPDWKDRLKIPEHGIPAKAGTFLFRIFASVSARRMQDFEVAGTLDEIIPCIPDTCFDDLVTKIYKWKESNKIP